MFGAISLDVTGAHGQPVPHWFIPAQSETSHLVVLLPGRAYGLDLPLLLYPAKLLHNKGADILGIDYTSYTADPEMSPDEIKRRLGSDVLAALNAGLEQRTYQRITLLGKSLGTIAMGRLITADPRLAQAECIWMTPLLLMEELRAQIAARPHRALFIGGTADEQFNLDHLAALEKATDGKSLVLEGANHILEKAGNVIESIQFLERVMRSIDEFIG